MTYSDFTYRCPRFVRESLEAIGGYEKMVVTIGCGVMSVMLCMLGYLTGGEYVAVTLGTVAVYISGKAVERMAETKSEAKVAEASSVARVAEAK